jgi:hypothetical protein
MGRGAMVLGSVIRWHGPPRWSVGSLCVQDFRSRTESLLAELYEKKKGAELKDSSRDWICESSIPPVIAAF